MSRLFIPRALGRLGTEHTRSASPIRCLVDQRIAGESENALADLVALDLRRTASDRKCTVHKLQCAAHEPWLLRALPAGRSGLVGSIPTPGTTRSQAPNLSAVWARVGSVDSELELLRRGRSVTSAQTNAMAASALTGYDAAPHRFEG